MSPRQEFYPSTTMDLSGYKTYITAAIAILTAVGVYLNDPSTLSADLIAILVALQTGFIRHGSKTDTAKIVDAVVAPPAPK